MVGTASSTICIACFSALPAEAQELPLFAYSTVEHLPCLLLGTGNGAAEAGTENRLFIVWWLLLWYYCLLLLVLAWSRMAPGWDHYENIDMPGLGDVELIRIR